MIKSSHHVALVFMTLAACLLYHCDHPWLCAGCCTALFPWEYFGRVCEEHVAPAVFAWMRKSKAKDRAVSNDVIKQELDKLGKM
jgi:hypothetical protein